MLTPEQSRAARGWLDWSQADLATRASVSLSTVRDFEKGRRMPIVNNLQAIQRAIEQAGVQLLFDEEQLGTGLSVAKKQATVGSPQNGKVKAAIALRE